MKTLKTAKNSLIRSRSRKSSRGVSMVEGALILPVLTVFFGLLQFVHAEYDAKMLTMWDAHNQAWDYASHGCVGGQGVTQGQPNQDANEAGSAISSLPNDPVSQKASDTLGDLGGSVMGAPGIVVRDATSLAKVSRYQRTIASSSWVFCNEQNYNNGSLGLLDEFYGAAGSYISNIQNRHK
jgi:hypothetical protein